MKAPRVRILLAGLLLASTAVSAPKSHEIVFSKNPIDPQNPTALTTTFQAGDSIYSVAYLEDTIPGILGKASNKSASVEVFLYELKAPL